VGTLFCETWSQLNIANSQRDFVVTLQNISFTAPPSGTTPGNTGS